MVPGMGQYQGEKVTGEDMFLYMELKSNTQGYSNRAKLHQDVTGEKGLGPEDPFWESRCKWSKSSPGDLS